MKIFDFQSPIVYTPEYDILFGGIERLYPFDTAKWGKAFTYLKGILEINRNINT